MSKVLDAINESNKKTDLEKKVEQENYTRWIKETNFKDKIKEFGYVSQRECIDAMGIPQSSFNQIINGKRSGKGYSKNYKIIYDFFHDEFNKKANISKPKIDNKVSDKEILDFFKRNTLKEIVRECGYKNSYNFAKDAGVSRSVATNLFSGLTKKITRKPRQLYDFIQEKLGNPVKLTETPQILTKDEESINIPEPEETLKQEPKKAEILSGENKDEAKGEQKKPKTTKKELKKKNKYLMKRLKEEIGLTITLLTKIEKKNKEIETLKKQIKRYEILIDRLK